MTHFSDSANGSPRASSLCVSSHGNLTGGSAFLLLVAWRRPPLRRPKGPRLERRLTLRSLVAAVGVPTHSETFSSGISLLKAPKEEGFPPSLCVGGRLIPLKMASKQAEGDPPRLASSTLVG